MPTRWDGIHLVLMITILCRMEWINFAKLNENKWSVVALHSYKRKEDRAGSIISESNVKIGHLL